MVFGSSWPKPGEQASRFASLSLFCKGCVTKASHHLCGRFFNVCLILVEDRQSLMSWLQLITSSALLKATPSLQNICTYKRTRDSLSF